MFWLSHLSYWHFININFKIKLGLRGGFGQIRLFTLIIIIISVIAVIILLI